MKEVEIIILVLVSLSFLVLVGILLLLLFKRSEKDMEGKLDANRGEIISSIHTALDSFGSLLNKSNEQFSKLLWNPQY